MNRIRITGRGKRVLMLLQSGFSLDEAEKIINEEPPRAENKVEIPREEFGKFFKKVDK